MRTTVHLFFLILIGSRSAYTITNGTTRNDTSISSSSIQLDVSRETDLEYHRTTESYKESGTCRDYFVLPAEMDTCNAYCDQNYPDHRSVTCEGPHIKDYNWYVENGETELISYNPDGYAWLVGKCLCKEPLLEVLVDEFVEDLGKGLQELQKALCGTVAQTIISIIDEGISAFPVGRAFELIEGVSTVIRGAKTIADNGFDAATGGGILGQWFGNMCNNKDYGLHPTEAIPHLIGLPAHVGTSLGCLRHDQKDCRRMIEPSPPKSKSKDKPTTKVTSKTTEVKTTSTEPQTSETSKPSTESTSTESASTESTSTESTSTESTKISTSSSSSSSSNSGSNSGSSTTKTCRVTKRSNRPQTVEAKFGEDESDRRCHGGIPTMHLTRTETQNIRTWEETIGKKCPKAAPQACYHYR
jgi:hypothetical protein